MGEDLTLSTQEEIEAQPKVLEIGPGLSPFLRTSQPHPKSIFYSLDVDTLGVRFARQARKEKPEVRGIDLQGDATSLPFPSHSLDQIILPNVLGISGLALKCPPYHYFFQTEPGKKIISEINRVLKPSGLLTIVETLTPPPNQT